MQTFVAVFISKESLIWIEIIFYSYQRNFHVLEPVMAEKILLAK